MTLALLGNQTDGTMQEKLPDQDDKREVIRAACRDGDIEALVRLADSAGGLLDDEFRATACEYSFQLRFSGLKRSPRAFALGHHRQGCCENGWRSMARSPSAFRRGAGAERR